MKSIRLGEYVGGGWHEVYINGDRYIWDEGGLRIYIKHCILEDMYSARSFYNRRRISRFLTTLVILGVGI